MFFISAVSANDLDANQTVELTDENDIIEVNENSMYVDDMWGNDLNDGRTEDTSVKSIRTALDYADENDTIYLAPGNYTSYDNTKITIDKSITIIGSKDTTIDGLNKDYLFVINDGVTVTFKNINFVNAYKAPDYDESVYGAALEIKNAKVTIENCSFIHDIVNHNTRKEVFGGAISNFGDLLILNSYFDDNRVAVNSGSNGIYSKGGAIYNEGKLIIKNSSILNSKAGTYSSGGAIANNGTLEIYSSNISNSFVDAQSKGGSAIYNTGNFYLTNSIIKDNTINNAELSSINGAIYNAGTFTAQSNIFQNNRLGDSSNKNRGGSANIYSTGKLNLTYNMFINNQNVNGLNHDVYNSGETISLDNNWWGTNNNPYDDGARISSNDVTSWLVFTLTPEYSCLNISDSVLIKASWQSNSGVCDIGLIPILNATFTAGDISKTVELKEGKAEFTYTDTHGKGLYEVTADVNGFTQVVEVDVGKAISNLSFNLTDNIQYLDTLKINVSVSGNALRTPTGEVLVKIRNGTKIVTTKAIELVDGSGSLEMSNLNPGKYNVEFVYNGDDNYFRAFEKTTLTIVKQPVNLSMTIPSIKIDEKRTYAYVCLDTVGAQGTAILYLNGEEYRKPYLYNGNTTITLQNLAEGEYNATLAFLGNDQFEAANVSTTFNVSKYSTLLNIYAHDINVGEVETIIIESLPEDLEGYAVLRINGVEEDIYIEGQANTTVNISDLGPGLFNVEILYTGDNKYYGTYDTTSFRVIRPNSSLDVNIVKDDHNVNGTITVTTNPSDCTGLIGVYVNYKFYSLNLTDGKAVFNVEFDRGTNYIFVYYEGNYYYESSNWNTTLGVADNFAFIGENVTCFERHDFNYSIRLVELNGIPMPNRNVVVKLGEDTWNITTDDDGFAYLPLNLKNGIYTIFATYQNETINNTLTIKEITYDIKVHDINCGEVESIEVTCDENLTGVFNLNIPKVLDVNLNITNGKVSYNLTGLAGGKYSLNVRYMNDNYTSSKKTKAFNVKKLNLELNVDFNQYDFIITVSNLKNATGNVVFVIDGKKYAAVINNSKASLTKHLDEGKHSLKVSYNGDDFYNSCSLSTTVDVKVFSTRLILSVNDAYYAESITAIANIDKNATGTIRFSVGNLTKDVKINKGVAKWTITGLNAGNYTINAVYLGDSFYAQSQNTTEFKVLKYTSKIVLKIKDTVFADNLTAVVNVNKNATGIVRFTVDNMTEDIEIVNGVAKWTFRCNDTGSYTIDAVYLGNLFYEESQTTAGFKVFKYDTGILLSINDAIYAENLTAVAKVNKDATGFVRFTVDDLTKDIKVENGVAKWIFSGVDAGNHTINATYLGDDYYFQSQNSTSFKIDKANSTIFLYVNEAVLYENIRIYADLPTNATGSVLFSMTDYYSPRYKNVYDSQSMWYISPLDTGVYEVYAKYAGDNNFNPSDTIKFLLNIYQKKAVLDVTIDDVRNVDRVVAKISLKNRTGDSINSVVRLQLNGNEYDIDVDGQTTWIVGKLPAGNYTYSASYAGNDEYAKSTVKGTFEVRDVLLDVVITANNLTKFYKGSKNLVITVKTTKGKVASGVSVYVTINGETYNAVTDSKGQASVDVDLKSGNYTALINIKEDDYYHEASANASITVLPTVEAIDLTKLYGTSSQYFAIFSDSNGKVLSNTKVKFTIGSNSYSANTLPNGVCRLNINLSPGTYYITAINPVTGEKTSNKIFIYNYLMKNKDVTKYYKGTKCYKVRAYGADGKAVGAGKTVTFKLNGKTYKVKTDEKGYASLSINLKPGKYTVKATYKKYTVKNKITVKTTLITKNLSKKKSKTTKYQAKLLNGKGKVLKGKKITFKFKGKTYKIKTNKKGIATLTIKTALKVGKYKIYSQYGKLKNTNVITIKR